SRPAPPITRRAPHNSGSDEQMFGDEQQIPHGEQNDEEADCHERVSTGKRPWLVGKARSGCGVGQTALMSSPHNWSTTMKTLATLAIAMMVSTASASAVPGFTFRYECKVTETTGSSDKDPVSKANIAIALTMVDDNHARPAFFVDATHTTASGATFNV